jgi:thiamine-monophosphate kinase
MRVRRGESISNARQGELALIDRIRRRANHLSSKGLRLGIGDDCAILRLKPDEELAVTTDLSIAGRHFRLEWHPPEAVGHRTLARGLSDLAAMGARPIAAFLSLGLPKELAAQRGRRPAWIDRFLDGFLALADQYQTPLAGGDLAESPLAAADIVLLGTVPRGKALLRSGARPGDVMFVTGALGGAAAGLELLRKGGGRTLSIARNSENRQDLLRAHFWSQPRIVQGLWLRRRQTATAAIDLSDGLSTDLDHLCAASEVSAEIDAGALPICANSTLNQALHGGEDYELLFTARPNTAIPRNIAGIRVTRIGRIVRREVRQPRVVLVDPSGRHTLHRGGWEHFSYGRGTSLYNH